MRKEMWKKEWPTESGYYWFYGWCFRSRNYPAEIHFVKTRYDGIGKPVYVTNGQFLYKEEGAEGFWQLAQLPELPNQGGQP